jgi:uncharacterized membrane protein
MLKLFRRSHDPIWHLQLGVLVVIALQLLTANDLQPINKYLLVGLEVLLLLVLEIVTPDGYHVVSPPRRLLAISLIGLVTATNIITLFLLVNALFNGHTSLDGRALLLNGVAIYVTNIFMFALWYWEMDGGGPDRRTTGQRRPDFLFTQMLHPQFIPKNWLPGFTDYLYLSASNVTNFASSDTLPATRRAKMLMMLQSLVSVVAIVLFAARAITILQ